MQNARLRYAGVHGPVLLSGDTAHDLSCAKVCCLVRELDAGNLHVRFDEEDVETE